MIHPWLDPLRQRLADGRGRLPPGLLLLGRAGIGKFGLAMELARSMLCADGGDIACGKCDACRGFDRGMCPDLHLLTTELFADGLEGVFASHAARYLEAAEDRRGRKPRQVITVDQVRALIAALGTRSHAGGGRVALLAPASALNVNAANALLKVLEEPPEGARFLLVASARDRLPATILSRVAVLDCHPPDPALGVEWLQGQGVPRDSASLLLELADQAPLTALALHREGIAERIPRWRESLDALAQGRASPFAVAATVGVEHLDRYLYWLEQHLCRELAARFGKPGAASAGQDNRLFSPRLWDIIGKIQVYRRYQQRAVDAQLFLEDVLVAVWQETGKASQTG